MGSTGPKSASSTFLGGIGVGVGWGGGVTSFGDGGFCFCLGDGVTEGGDLDFGEGCFDCGFSFSPFCKQNES